MSGFDCPGCAWPDPDDKRSVLGEYCENGAKALAEEAAEEVAEAAEEAAEEASESSEEEATDDEEDKEGKA